MSTGLDFPNRSTRSSFPSAARVTAILVLATASASAAVSMFPGAGLVVAFVLIAATALVVLNRARPLEPLRTPWIVGVPVALIFMSIIRVELRDATAGGLGKQAEYEFALQLVAAGVVAVGIFAGQLKLRFNGLGGVWLAVAVLGAVSSLWAANPVLAFAKGVQLGTLVVVIGIIGANAHSRRDIARFLGRASAAILLAVATIQVALYGPNSLIEIDEQGRHRLAILAVHPLALAGLCGALALMLLIDHPDWADWLLVALFSTVCVLTGSRIPAAALLVCVALNLVVRSLSLRDTRWVSLSGLSAFALALLGAAAYLLNDASLSISAWIDARVPTDASTLNGRLPLWHATVQNVLGEAVGTRELLFGHGFASFRLFGLSLFAYAGEAHNAALQVLYELGLVGLAVWTVAILLTFHHMWRSGAGRRERLFIALFCVYLIAIESADSSLADSRSFLLIFILLYAHAPGTVARSAVERATAPVRRWRMLSAEQIASQPAEFAVRDTR